MREDEWEREGREVGEGRGGRRGRGKLHEEDKSLYNHRKDTYIQPGCHKAKQFIQRVCWYIGYKRVDQVKHQAPCMCV